MRILVASQYFNPERTAPSLRLGPLVEGLADRGHEVEVICEIPSHPEGLVYPGYRQRRVVHRVSDGLAVHHLRTWTASNKARDRAASYLSYAAIATAFGALRERPEVIFASSPPLPVGVVGGALAARFRVPWVLDVRDLWPEVAIALGELPPNRASQALREVEEALYRSAAAITVPTPAYRSTILDTQPDADVELLPNGTTRLWLDVGSETHDKESLGLPADGFLWTYAGNVGLSQNLDNAVAAARKLGSGFRLLILGDGASRPGLQQLASDLDERQVLFRDAVPPAAAARIMAASDALLVSLADNSTLAKTIPVKLYDACAVGSPVVLAAPGESRALAEQFRAAECVAPADPTALADAVRRLRDSAALRRQLVDGGRRLALDNLRSNHVAALESVLAGVISGFR